MLVALVLAAALHHTPVPPGPPRRAITVEYRVQRGDTLWSISARLSGGGVHWRWITRANGQRPDPRHLHVGQLLAVPATSA